MKFGKLENVDIINFELQDPIFLNTNNRTEVDQNFKLYLGATGWSHTQWKGTLYPPKTKSTEFLKQYGKQFNCIELNATHYRIPPPEMVLKWKSVVPDDFKFAPKILQYISHSRKLGTDSDRIDRFCDSMRLFENNLGPCFLQLPPHFSPVKMPILEEFIDVWPKDLPLAVELRHPDWFLQSNEMELLLSILTDLNIDLLVTDVAGRRDVAHPYQTSNFKIIRFGGNFPHNSDEKRLESYVEIIKKSFKNGIKEYYFFSHQQDANVYGIVRDLQYLQRKLAASLNIKTRTPNLIIQPNSLF